MNIGFSGDGPSFDDICRYELLTIDEVTEDLVVWLPGTAGAVFKYYADFSNLAGNDGNQGTIPSDGYQPTELIHIKTQQQAQETLETINHAIIKKDGIRAHLGAMQNRLENTITNLSIQGENLQATESRISDTDVATEMTSFVRNQVLTQAAVAANTYPHMLINLLTG